MTELVHLETIAEAPNFGDVIFRRIEPFLGRNVLDVGIGIGIFTGRLLARCEKVAGVELVAEFIDIARRRYAGRNLELIQADMGAALPPALAGRRFDTVLWINVLEHIDDDILALRNSHDLLDPGGRLVLVVPDCPWLFNKLDVYGGHFRRYDKAEIASKLERTGFALEHCKSFNMTGILGWFVKGSILRRKYPPKGHVRMFDRLAPWLDALEAFIGPPFGMSIVVVGRK